MGKGERGTERKMLDSRRNDRERGKWGGERGQRDGGERTRGIGEEV
jgi:hypothetical protein